MENNDFLIKPKAFSSPEIRPVEPGKVTWEEYMQLALDEANEALICNEVPVGAIIIDDKGTVISKAHNSPTTSYDPSAHAEILAIRKAGLALKNYRLENCILIVTLEPCAMCAGAIIHARLNGVVYAAADTISGAIISRAELLDAPASTRPVWHMGGILAQESTNLLQTFFKNKR